MEETNWSSDFYSNIFSLEFDSLFSTIDLESLGSKENSDTVPEVLNTTNRERKSEQSWRKQQTTYQDQTSPGFHLLPLTKSKKQSTKQSTKQKHKKKYKYVDKSLVFLDKVTSNQREYRNNGARNFRRSPPKILSGIEKARRRRL